MKKTIKQLNALKKEELVIIGKKYGLFAVESMSKKELINNILIQNGFTPKTKKEIILKKSKTQVFFNWILLFIIISLFIYGFSSLFTNIYFYHIMFKERIDDRNFNFQITLSILSMIYSFFIWYWYWKNKYITTIFKIGFALSIGYFVYFLVVYYQEIASLRTDLQSGKEIENSILNPFSSLENNEWWSDKWDFIFPHMPKLQGTTFDPLLFTEKEKIIIKNDISTLESRIDIFNILFIFWISISSVLLLSIFTLWVLMKFI